MTAPLLAGAAQQGEPDWPALDSAIHAYRDAWGSGYSYAERTATFEDVERAFLEYLADYPKAFDEWRAAASGSARPPEPTESDEALDLRDDWERLVEENTALRAEVALLRGSARPRAADPTCSLDHTPNATLAAMEAAERGEVEPLWGDEDLPHDSLEGFLAWVEMHNAPSTSQRVAGLARKYHEALRAALSGGAAEPQEG